MEAWRIHYNQRRPHSALGWMTPPNLLKNLSVARICSHPEVENF
ncbi:integrase core domain-containing protein [Dickeya oryzae]|uniref:Integrase core domain-containing protein n=1 Tax=Dickeya oryzae TaxID=1240404 RepID=A0ABS5BHN1_9GAMM|nr:integrase core domain-containing protein [Dickeya oryzae]